jgi:hypothetical protein
MTGGRAGHATLPCEWGSKCLTVAALTKHGHAHRLSTPQKKHTSWNGGGGTGGVHCGVAQERSSTSPHHPPTPTHVQGKIYVAQARHLTSPILPRRTHQTWNGGGGQGVFTLASPKNSTKSRLPPPKKNHHTCNGGGERGIQRGVAQARQCTSPIPPTPVPYPPLPPPPPSLMSWKNKNKK